MQRFKLVWSHGEDSVVGRVYRSVAGGYRLRDRLRVKWTNNKAEQYLNERGMSIRQRKELRRL